MCGGKKKVRDDHSLISNTSDCPADSSQTKKFKEARNHHAKSPKRPQSPHPSPDPPPSQENVKEERKRVKPPSSSGSLLSTPTKKETPLQHIHVESPKLMYARRKIDHVRDSRDAEYKTSLDKSEWQEAEIVKRVDLKHDQTWSTVSRPTESVKPEK